MSTNKEYNPKELLEIELETPTLNLQIATEDTTYKLNLGKNRLTVLAEHLALFEKLVEPELDTLERAKKVYDRRKTETAMKVKKDEDGLPVDPGVQKALMLGFKYDNSPQKIFREETGRDPKPILSLKVVGSKGIQKSDTEKTIEIAQAAATKSQAETIAAVLAAMKQMDKK